MRHRYRYEEVVVVLGHGLVVLAVQVAGLDIRNAHQPDQHADGQVLNSWLDFFKKVIKLYLLVRDHVLACVLNEQRLDVRRVDVRQVLVYFGRLDLC